MNKTGKISMSFRLSMKYLGTIHEVSLEEILHIMKARCLDKSSIPQQLFELQFVNEDFRIFNQFH